MHLFKSRLRCLLRNRELVFWTFLFPIALSLFFSLAFGNILRGEVFVSVPIAIVETDFNDPNFENFLENATIDGSKNAFTITKTTLSEALTMLDNNQIRGIIEEKSDNKIDVTFKQSGLSETIVKIFLDEYIQRRHIVLDFIARGDVDINLILEDLTNQETFVVANETNVNIPDVTLSYFYALIGMALIYGGLWGTYEITNIQPNISAKGIRISIAPTKRMRMLLIHISAAFIVHFSGILLFLAFLRFALNISFGTKIIPLLSLCALGSVTGIAFGAFLSMALKKTSEGLKSSIVSLIGVVGGFLSGMMFPEMKYYVMQNMRFLTFINPVFFISDGLFSLYYFPTLTRYWENTMLLGAMCLLLIIGTYLFFRRDDYESI